MKQDKNEYLMDVQALRRKDTLDHLRAEPELGSPEEEGEAAAHRIIASLREDREKTRLKQNHHA
ncbi:hypothetical protein [Methylobacterium organophilum]|uniref:hypothetical protein n=1 Tax=Methylobacterium organophilum TaxID=410 RepID=UPI001EE2EAA4|nr:hypothetical protein [Methylobacterium organophilum]